MKSFFAALPFALISFNDIAPLNPKTVTVSGLSSGSMMSIQMLVTSSSTIQGAGLIAGGPFGCSAGLLGQAFQCIGYPETINTSRLAEMTQNLARQGKIDDLKNLKKRSVFVLNGKQDTVVLSEAGPKTVEYLQNFMPLENITTEFTLEAGHGMPTMNRGHNCRAEAAPWVNSCDYDGAQNTLETLLRKKLVVGKQNREHLYQLDVSAHILFGSNINSTSLIYIPQSCLSLNQRRQTKTQDQTAVGSLCDLHVVFHGCRQTLDEAGLDFINLAGYNDWAEKNNLVILYPNIIKTPMNPKGCWDWWGYSGAEFLTRYGLQIKSINQLIHALTR